MKGKVLVRTRVSKETAAGCVSTGVCYRKNDNKDTNGSKGSIFVRSWIHVHRRDLLCHFQAVVVVLVDFGALGEGSR